MSFNVNKASEDELKALIKKIQNEQSHRWSQQIKKINVIREEET